MMSFQAAVKLCLRQRCSVFVHHVEKSPEYLLFKSNHSLDVHLMYVSGKRRNI